MLEFRRRHMSHAGRYIAAMQTERQAVIITGPYTGLGTRLPKHAPAPVTTMSVCRRESPELGLTTVGVRRITSRGRDRGATDDSREGHGAQGEGERGWIMTTGFLEKSDD
jgi:hypothetical protein